MEEHHADDQSHYEISLTAGQAFVAFVLLLLSLAAAFAFGLMIGKGQADERLVVRKEGPVVTEARLAPRKNEGRIVELGVEDNDFTATDTAAAPPTDTTATTTVIEEGPAAAGEPSLGSAEAARTGVETPAAPHPLKLNATHYAQLLSTGDQRVAESLAARLIERGFTSAYVERGATDKGPIYRVRVRFDSEADARAAEPRLREFSKEVWITSK